MFIFTLKNMIRYKTRNILTLSTVVFTTIVIVIMFAYTTSIIDLFMNSYINYQTGHIKLMTKKYYENRRFMPVYEYIENVSSLLDDIKQDKNVKSAFAMYNFFTLLGGNENTTQIRGLGIDFQNNTFNINKRLIEGTDKEGGLLIGEKLTKKTSLSLYSNALVVSSSADGGLNAVKVPVNGIYNFNMKLYDTSTIFLSLKDTQNLLHANDGATEVLIILNDESKLNDTTKMLTEKYPDLKVQTYKEQLGGMYAYIDIFKNIMWLITIFIMLLGSLVVANSLIASIYDRIGEIGMMKAIGFRDKELSKMLFYEGLVFGFIGAVIGSAIGFTIVARLGISGIDVSAFMGTLPIDSTIYPKLNIFTMTLCFTIAVFVPAFVTIIPMRHIKRITPVEALRY